MSSPAGNEAIRPDDWDSHWDSYGEAATTNPANVYRRKVILRLLGPVSAGDTLLDIGSGQGEFSIDFKLTHRAVDVWGVEYSQAGVTRASKAAAASGASVEYRQVDLLQPVTPGLTTPASHAICSEVLEHVDDPALLMRNAVALLAPGCRVVVTVPGGPRSAFDRHIGHRRHFTARSLETTLTQAGLSVDRVVRTGFPFFNLYKLAVIARNKRLISDFENRSPDAVPSRAEKVVTNFFNVTFRLNLLNFPLGWQLAAVAHVPSSRNI